MIANKTIAIKRNTMKNNIWEDIDGNKYDANEVVNLVSNKIRRPVVVGQFYNENGKWYFSEIFGYNAGMRRDI